MAIIEGTSGRILPFAGVPGAGTNEVQTLTIGGTPTAGSFTLTFDGYTTSAITWSNVNVTLLAAINAALDLLPNLSAGAVVATAGTLTAGIGTILLTFSGGNVQKKAVSTMSATSSLTGTAPTLAIVETTPGVDASYRGQGKGTIVADVTNGKLYVNTGVALAPVWTVVGTQT